MFSKKIIFPLLGALLLSGCQILTDEEFETMQKENEQKITVLKDRNAQLQSKNQKLESELTSLKVNKPKFMELLMTAQEIGDDRAIIKNATILEKNFPNSKEALIAKELKEDALARVHKEMELKTAHLEKKEDRKQGISWYFDKKNKTSLATTPLFLYISKKDLDINLNLRLQTTDAGLNLTKGFMLISDKASYSIVPTEKKLKQKQISGGVWIWTEQRVDKKDLDMLKDIIYSKKPKIRFLRKDSYEELPITPSLRESMIRVINGFNSIVNISEIKENL